MNHQYHNIDRGLRRAYPLFLICWLGFTLRVSWLDRQPFWFDEGLTVDLVLASPLYVLETIDRPPLYYLLVHAWVGVVGNVPFAFRFFSAWWGVLVLPLTYRFGHRLMSRRASTWALLLAALCPFYIYYAQEARTYAVTLALALSSSLVLLAWLDRRRWHLMALYAATTLLCLYTHYVALLLPLAQTAFVLLSARRIGSRSVLSCVAAQAVVGLLFLLWPLHVWYKLPELIMPELITPPLEPARYAADVLWTTLVEFSAGRTLGGPMAGGAALLFLFLVVLGIVSPYTSSRARRFLLSLLGLPTAVLLLLPRTAVYFSPKYLIVAAPAFYLLAITGLQTLHREIRWLFWVCALLVVLILTLGLADWFFQLHIKVA
ncbi:MAG: glycosyltransferase family 39 protein [Anaerolineae bacterium]|nr:glycosyltransferase family 39 protein [Anaerolineae bacterium]